MARDSDTPMMMQYQEMKAKHPEAILLFRVGDFYEAYEDDAKAMSAILGITLTRRICSKKEKAMSGFPHHALDTYLPRLVRAGRRVAICDQMEDPSKTKTLVKRGITELVTPGLSMTDNLLDFKENNFLAALHTNSKKEMAGVAFLDLSTGEMLTSEGSYEYIDKLLSSMKPKELVYEKGKRVEIEDHFTSKPSTYEMDEWIFNSQTAEDRLLKNFEVGSLKGFGIESMPLAIVACGAVFHYLDFTQHTMQGHIRTISRIERDNFMWLDSFTVRNLELFDSTYQGGKSLVATIDRTTSPMGARLLRRWIGFPLKEVKPIEDRHQVVESFFRDPERASQIGGYLAQIGDIERLISKVSVNRINPKELSQLKRALFALKPLKELCSGSGCDELKRIGEQINDCGSLAQKIDSALVEDPPTQPNKGMVVKEGFNEELDEFRSLKKDTRKTLLDMQNREIQRTGIGTLKIDYNNVFGYYIQISNTYKERMQKLLDAGYLTGWVRKQTLATGERYINQDLQDLAVKIQSADDNIGRIELQVFTDLVQEAFTYLNTIQLDSTLVAQIDCLLSFAKIAQENNYVRPVMDKGLVVDIRQGRHPVIEKQLPIGQEYTPNDLKIDNDDTQIMMITGPNMAGKSALLRQTALIVLMAQIGSFVPAQSATIGVVDKIFTRVGASDNISMGESTFMVEMNEAASIINNLSERSLVLFDELGRGTSTYDGISIAWAIVEYIHENPKAHAKTLFATHYHELNEMANTYKRIKNYNVQVKEADGKIVFLRKLAEGGSEHSFGIHVAKLAGLPQDVVDRANSVLRQLENAAGGSTALSGANANTAAIDKTEPKVNIFDIEDPVLKGIRDQIANLDINNTTPMEAMQLLNNIKRLVVGGL